MTALSGPLETPAATRFWSGAEIVSCSFMIVRPDWSVTIRLVTP